MSHERYVDPYGVTWLQPTAEAYALTCAALHRKEDEVVKLKEHIDSIDWVVRENARLVGANAAMAREAEKSVAFEKANTEDSDSDARYWRRISEQLAVRVEAAEKQACKHKHLTSASKDPDVMDLEAENAWLRKNLQDFRNLPSTIETGIAQCGHNKYWTGHFGTCMVCRAEVAEKKLKVMTDGFDASSQSEDELRKLLAESRSKINSAISTLLAYDPGDWAIDSGHFRNSIELALDHLGHVPKGSRHPCDGKMCEGDGICNRCGRTLM